MPVFFQNDGVIDMRAVTTFGVSVKETENPIGFFGTGFKYAIAIILRNGGSITVWAGLQKHEFKLETENIRGEEFHTVMMNGERLAFTTQLGKTWEPWQALREIESNCRDENGVSSFSDLQPSEGKTTILVKNFPKFEESFADIGSVFLNEVPEVRTKGLEILRKPRFPGRIYYRGIAVGQIPDSVYAYNVIKAISLTEDRTIKDDYAVRVAIAEGMISAVEDEGFIEEFLTAKKDSFENRLDMNWSYFEPSDAFKRVGAELLASKKEMNNTARAFLTRKMPQTTKLQEVPLSDIQEKQLKKAVEFLSMIFDFRKDRYPIKVVDSIQGTALGIAQDKTIFMSRAAFDLGTKVVAGTILEEYIHLDAGLPDESRRMQEYLLNLCITLGEMIAGEPI